MYEKAFKEDWKKCKTELEKIGVKKPAELKRIGLFDKRVSSGIGKACKAIDAADPKDINAVDAKAVSKYETALKLLNTAVDKELNAIEKEIKSQKDLHKDEKTVYYRGLKVFKAKLNDYVAQAEKRLNEMSLVGSKMAEHEKRLKKAKPALKASIANTVTGIKKTKMDPVTKTYDTEIVKPVGVLCLACDEMKSFPGDWEGFRDKVSKFKHTPFNDKDIVGRLKELADLIKKITAALAKV